MRPFYQRKMSNLYRNSTASIPNTFYIAKLYSTVVKILIGRQVSGRAYTELIHSGLDYNRTSFEQLTGKVYKVIDMRQEVRHVEYIIAPSVDIRLGEAVLKMCSAAKEVAGGFRFRDQ